MSERLGQHFLKNKDAIQKIIAALLLERGDFLIEIGPGRGELTIPLAETCARAGCGLIAIEKDAGLVDKLKSSQVGKLVNVEIVQGDVLKELARLASQSRGSLGLRSEDGGREMAADYKIVGNIPYYITGHLLRTISELPIKPTRTVLTVQKEVAERIVAKPPHMNLLSAAVRFWAEPAIIGYLLPQDFDPPPEVESAIITLQSLDQEKKHEHDLYYQFIRRAFKQPRKTLLNNLEEATKPRSGGLSKQEIFEKLKKFGLNEFTRAQELSIEELKALSREF